MSQFLRTHLSLGTSKMLAALLLKLSSPAEITGVLLRDLQPPGLLSFLKGCILMQELHLPRASWGREWVEEETEDTPTEDEPGTRTGLHWSDWRPTHCFKSQRSGDSCLMEKCSRTPKEFDAAATQRTSQLRLQLITLICRIEIC